MPTEDQDICAHGVYANVELNHFNSGRLRNSSRPSVVSHPLYWRCEDYIWHGVASRNLRSSVPLDIVGPSV